MCPCPDLGDILWLTNTEQATNPLLPLDISEKNPPKTGFFLISPYKSIEVQGVIVVEMGQVRDHLNSLVTAVRAGMTSDDMYVFYKKSQVKI